MSASVAGWALKLIQGQARIMSEPPILRVRNLAKHFPVNGGYFSSASDCVKAVDDISFDVFPGGTLGIVGESGCGKSTTARMLIGLTKPTRGDIFFQGRSLLQANKSQLKMLHREMQIIFQDSSGSLNPRMKTADLIGEPLKIQGFGKQECQQRVNKLMEIVGLATYHSDRYPHELSGGQRQRIGIARALALNPKFIICDEPLSALDVSVQGQIVNLLKDLQSEFNLTYLFISHDLAVIRHMCDAVAIMYCGKIVELGAAGEIFETPLHPYTEALISAIPVPDPSATKKKTLCDGDVADSIHIPAGCRYHPRCPHAQEICCSRAPEFIDSHGGHLVACHLRNHR
jgi:oligopeptide transport system ATP-binding protein